MNTQPDEVLHYFQVLRFDDYFINEFNYAEVISNRLNKEINWLNCKEVFFYFINVKRRDKSALEQHLQVCDLSDLLNKNGINCRFVSRVVDDILTYVDNKPLLSNVQLMLFDENDKKSNDKILQKEITEAEKRLQHLKSL